MSAGKQQLQYNLMGNKFPFLLSTWPPTTNPEAGRVVNFHGKVVNFNKQQPFLCFGRRSHRHLYSLPGLKCLNLIRGNRGKMWGWYCGSLLQLHVCVQVCSCFFFSAAVTHLNRRIFNDFSRHLIWNGRFFFSFLSFWTHTPVVASSLRPKRGWIEFFPPFGPGYFLHYDLWRISSLCAGN